MQAAHDTDDGLLSDEQRAHIRAVLGAQQVRGIEDARRLVVGVETCLRAGGEYADRVRGALLELLGNALTPAKSVEQDLEPARARRFWDRAEVANRPNAKVG